MSISLTQTGHHVEALIEGFLKVIPTLVMKFNDFDIFGPAAWKVWMTSLFGNRRSFNTKHKNWNGNLCNIIWV